MAYWHCGIPLKVTTHQIYRLAWGRGMPALLARFNTRSFDTPLAVTRVVFQDSMPDHFKTPPASQLKNMDMKS
jgi:hypothetical protein